MTKQLNLTRTPPEAMEPVPLHIGDSVQFVETKTWWRVRAVSDRFVILTSPFNLPTYPCPDDYHERKGPHDHVSYTIIDWERGVRGPDDHYGLGYESDAEIARAMQCLLYGATPFDVEHARPHVTDDGVIAAEVSHRAHTIRLRIARIKRRTPVEDPMTGLSAPSSFDTITS